MLLLLPSLPLSSFLLACLVSACTNNHCLRSFSLLSLSSFLLACLVSARTNEGYKILWHGKNPATTKYIKCLPKNKKGFKSKFSKITITWNQLYCSKLPANWVCNGTHYCFILVFVSPTAIFWTHCGNNSQEDVGEANRPQAVTYFSGLSGLGSLYDQRRNQNL